MTQNTEKNVRTREEQLSACVNDWSTEGMGRAWARKWSAQMILEAEARGAEKQRRKDREKREVDKDLIIRAWMGQASLSEEEATLDYEWWKDRVDTPPSGIANVPALEAEIAFLKEAEQLARADAEASKARLGFLQADCNKYRTALEAVATNKTADCPAPDMTYLRRIGWALVWCRRTAQAALTREGGGCDGRD